MPRAKRAKMGHQMQGDRRFSYIAVNFHPEVRIY